MRSSLRSPVCASAICFILYPVCMCRCVRFGRTAWQSTFISDHCPLFIVIPYPCPCPYPYPYPYPYPCSFSCSCLCLCFCPRSPIRSFVLVCFLASPLFLISHFLFMLRYCCACACSSVNHSSAHAARHTLALTYSLTHTHTHTHTHTLILHPSPNPNLIPNPGWCIVTNIRFGPIAFWPLTFDLWPLVFWCFGSWFLVREYMYTCTCTLIG